ncbi:sensor histidine kinase [Candidatus Pristimantibacillus sp. PTI5]|uniref:sensor histidine kinase n=1 Tax=Candidatus Pristimantibacillus sp. PTI5 TaxID=3400422 RepID=UPI003B016044
MIKQYRTFFSILLLTLLSTVIVMIMYTYTVNISLKTVRDDIQSNNLNRLRFLVINLDHNVKQLNMLATALQADTKVGLLPSIDIMDSYDQVRLTMDLSDKMHLQSFSEGWDNQISIYASRINQWIGSVPGQHSPPTGVTSGVWTLDPALRLFTTYRSYNGYTIRVTFPENNLKEILDRAMIGNNDPFFFHPDNPVINNRLTNSGNSDKILSQLSPLLAGRQEGSDVVSVEGTNYLVNFMKSETLGWYAVDYLPLDEALQPIVRTKYFFYIACIMLFLAGMVIVLFLYRKVQVPIITLLKGVRLLKHGNFSHRIKKVSRNEFDLLYDNFNDMAEQIEDLIEKVFKEKIVSREAMIKQLQAQINPHFLYNCLFFINNMTRLGNDVAVTAMTQNLAEYFRYTTRLDEPMTLLEKELGVVDNYLTIQCLRMERLRYEIDIPESMKRLPVPKLLIQPLVENSVIHGIENKQRAGLVRITGREEENRYRLTIEDDGKGMTDKDIQTLLERIKQPLEDTMGCALWNIHQRMLIHFEELSGMDIGHSALGGLSVTLYWTRPKRQED